MSQRFTSKHYHICALARQGFNAEQIVGKTGYPSETVKQVLRINFLKDKKAGIVHSKCSAKKRRCLSCARHFDSASASNRRCEDCRKKLQGVPDAYSLEGTQ